MIIVAKIIVVKDIVLHYYNCKKHLKYDLVMDVIMDWGLALCLTFVTLEVPNKSNKGSPN
jgi:hypothetical protein